MKHHPYNLKGSTLEVFSALYCLTRKRAFRGTYEDLASWIEIETKTVKRSVSKLVEQGLVVVEKVEGSYYQYEFRAQAIPEHPLPEYQYIGGQNVQIGGQIVQKGGQNVQHNNTIYNTIFNKKERNKKENNYYRSAPYEVSPEVLALEEQMREQRRREREKMERESSTPEAKAAAQAFFDKFCKK